MISNKLLMLSLSVFLLVACSKESNPSNNAEPESAAGEEPFVNPVFECGSKNVVEPGEGYPHPLQQFPFTDKQERSVAELQNFCERMQTRFAESGMTDEEAQRVYEAIPRVLNIADESYGMPPDDAAAPGPVDLSTRVMLRKLGEDRYELFYFTIGCGRNYSLYEIDLSETEPQQKQIEEWSETSPC